MKLAFLFSMFVAAAAAYAQPCFIYCDLGCRISKGATFDESKDIYAELSHAEFLKAGIFKIKPPVRASVEVQLAKLQTDGTCDATATNNSGQCSSIFYQNDYGQFYDILTPGSNPRVIMGVRPTELATETQKLTQLGQCQN